MLYVGEGDPIRPRLERHYAEKDLWTRASSPWPAPPNACQGFVVRSASQAVADTAPGMAQHVRGMFDLRQELISNGVLALQGALYQFTQDYTFSAPSTAAAVVLGRSANGRVEWKAADGRTLKEIQEAEAGQ